MELHQIHLYRMTHIKNIPHILEHGITHRHSPNANPDYLPIGDQSLIKTRDNKFVHITNGDWDLTDVPTIKLGDYRRKKQAEFLVASDLPVETIRGYVCIDEQTSQRLSSMGIDEDNIRVYPKAYY